MTDVHVPIENRAAEWTSAARPAEEDVPDGVAEGSRLGRGAEARGASRTAEGNRDDLALGLASLNLRSEERAVGELRAREVWIT